jgi:diacylglycerol O-acyltransferase
MGYRSLSLIPLPPSMLHLRLGVAMTSYAEDLAFGIIGNFDTPLYVNELASGISDGVNCLGRAPPPARLRRR